MNIHKNALDGARSTLAGAAGRGTRLADGGSGQGGRHIAAARLSLVGTLRHHGIGWEALHVCIDDATRLGYSEILPDERKGSAVGFLERALGWFAQHGVTVERLMTDNGSAYLSQDFRAAVAAAGLKHNAPSRTRRAPTGKPRGLSKPACASGPMPKLTQPRRSASRRWHPGLITTIPRGHTPAWAMVRQQPGCANSSCFVRPKGPLLRPDLLPSTTAAAARRCGHARSSSDPCVIY